MRSLRRTLLPVVALVSFAVPATAGQVRVTFSVGQAIFDVSDGSDSIAASEDFPTFSFEAVFPGVPLSASSPYGIITGTTGRLELFALEVSERTDFPGFEATEDGQFSIPGTVPLVRSGALFVDSVVATVMGMATKHCFAFGLGNCGGGGTTPFGYGYTEKTTALDADGAIPVGGLEIDPDGGLDLSWALAGGGTGSLTLFVDEAFQLYEDVPEPARAPLLAGAFGLALLAVLRRRR
jgi:hypothetical protein